MENDLVKKLMWSGLMAVLGVVASITARKAGEQIWVRVMGEEPPVD